MLTHRTVCTGGSVTYLHRRVGRVYGSGGTRALRLESWRADLDFVSSAQAPWKIWGALAPIFPRTEKEEAKGSKAPFRAAEEW